MLIEIDEVAIEETQWLAATTGDDDDARAAVRKLVDGLHLSLHLLSMDPTKRYVIVTLRDLDEHNLVDGVRCEAPE